MLGLFLAGLIGISLGLLGGGGSTLAVPILLYVSHLPAREAIVTSLVVVGVTSLFGAIRHWGWGNIDARAALIFGAISMAGSFTGGRAATYVPEPVQITGFAIVMITASLFMYRSASKSSDSAISPHASSLAIVLPVGFGVGALTGLVGIGGGFLIVPALVLLAGIDMKRAVGTSLLVISMNCLSGFLGYHGRVEVDWRYTIAFTVVAIGGAAIGTALVKHVSQKRLKKAFAVFLLVVGGFVLFNAHDVKKSPPGKSVTGSYSR